MNPRTKLKRARLSVVLPLKRKPDENMVEMLGEFYQAVQGGEIAGLAIAAVDRDGGTHTGFVALEPGRAIALIGATEYLAHRIKQRMLQTA